MVERMSGETVIGEMVRQLEGDAVRRLKGETMKRREGETAAGKTVKR